MSERTFSRSHWEAALEAWDAGKFSDEWKPYRHEAAMRGMIYPPEGSRFDSWEDDDPSERAMLIRAIRETPNLLHRAIAERKSWSGVVAYIVRERDEWRAEVTRHERALEQRTRRSRARSSPSSEPSTGSSSTASTSQRPP